jgi:hypothetical protein
MILLAEDRDVRPRASQAGNVRVVQVHGNPDTAYLN